MIFFICQRIWKTVKCQGKSGNFEVDDKWQPSLNEYSYNVSKCSPCMMVSTLYDNVVIFQSEMSFITKEWKGNLIHPIFIASEVLLHSLL